MITINEAIEIIQSTTIAGIKVPFDVVFYSYNEALKKAGKCIELKGVVSAGYNHDVVENGIYNIKAANGEYYPIHLWLIESINGNELMLR